MEIILSNASPKPIYEQITSQIKAMIMNGELKAGDPDAVHAKACKGASRQCDHDTESL